MKIPSDMDIDKAELQDIDKMGEADDLLLNSDIANGENQINHFGDYQHENQHIFYFGAN